jgi:hypothetical protein
MILSAALLVAVMQRGAPPPVTPPAPLEPGSVEGLVVEAGTARPLPRATIQLEARSAQPPAGVMVTNSRDDGTFIFKNVPAGPISLIAELGGYIPEAFGSAPDPYNTPTPALLPGQKMTGVRMALTRGGVIAGRLIDDRGDAVVGATVQAMKTTYVNGLPERREAQSAISNDLGEYRLFMLRPGEYHISMVPRTLVSPPVPRQPRVIPLYFPGTIDAKASQAIELHEGEALEGVNFSGIPTRTRRVTGSVQGNAGDGTSVILSPLNGTSTMQQTADPNTGSFQFADVAPGAYLLAAKTSTLRSVISLDVRNADVLNLRISLGAGYRIPVHVHIDGHPAGDDPELERLYFIARPETLVPGLEPDTYSPFPNGRFALDLLAGDYRLDITQPENAYVKAMTLGGIDVLNQGLRVTQSTEQTLEILIASNSGALDGRAERDATVVLVPDIPRRGQRALFKSVKSGGGGAFRFQNVPPGDYKLFAWTEENGGPWRDTEYLRKYEDRGVPVHVDENQKTTLDRPIPVY